MMQLRVPAVHQGDAYHMVVRVRVRVQVLYLHAGSVSRCLSLCVRVCVCSTYCKRMLVLRVSVADNMTAAQHALQ
jgi:hypothetical protein